MEVMEEALVLAAVAIGICLLLSLGMRWRQGTLDWVETRQLLYILALHLPLFLLPAAPAVLVARALRFPLPADAAIRVLVWLAATAAMGRILDWRGWHDRTTGPSQERLETLSWAVGLSPFLAHLFRAGPATFALLRMANRNDLTTCRRLVQLLQALYGDRLDSLLRLPQLPNSSPPSSLRNGFWSVFARDFLWLYFLDEMVEPCLARDRRLVDLVLVANATECSNLDPILFHLVAEDAIGHLTRRLRSELSLPPPLGRSKGSAVPGLLDALRILVGGQTRWGAGDVAGHPALVTAMLAVTRALARDAGLHLILANPDAFENAAQATTELRLLVPPT